MHRRSAGLTLALAVAFALPARGQSYPAPTYQGVTLLADPSATTQAARKGYVDTAAGARILTSTLGQASGPAQLGSNGLLPVAQLPVGTTTGTIAAGDDSRITGALSASTAAATYAARAGAAFTGLTSFAAGASVTGGLTADAAVVSAAITAERVVSYQAAGALRWKAGIAASTEPGANVGSDYALYRYADNGAYIARAFAVSRATGLLTIDAGASITGGLTLSTPLGIASGGTGQTTATAALAALGGAPLASPNFSGAVTLNTTPIVDTTLALQANAAASGQQYLAVNKGGGYGLLIGYDNGANPAAQIRQVSGTDPLNFVVNNTIQALSMTSDGNARFSGIATAATLRVGTTAGPTWTTGTGAPTSTQPLGSFYSRTDGTYGSTFYVSHGGGNWTAAMGL